MSGTARSPRLASLDAFRGFVIMGMVFVNYVAGIRGVPAWLKHAPGGVDAYTVVDVVLPGFIFIVGVSIPLSLGRRLREGRWLELLWRVFRRVASLLFLGVVMVSANRFSPEDVGMPEWRWSMLFFLAVLVVWAEIPREAAGRRRFAAVAGKIAAAGVMAYLVFIFRQKLGDGSVVWLRTSWWGILGIIGWTYLAGCLAYLVSRGDRTGLMGILGLTVAVYAADRHDSLPGFLDIAGRYVHIGGFFGSYATMVVAGVIVGGLLAGRERAAGRSLFMLLFGLGLFAAGTLIRPLHGISKLGATDAWALVTAGECCLGLLLFHLIMDVRGWTKWAWPLSEAGRNALAAYILPTIFGGILSLTGTWGFFWRSWEGWTGVGNAAVITVVIVAITAALTRLRVILKL